FPMSVNSPQLVDQIAAIVTEVLAEQQRNGAPKSGGGSGTACSLPHGVASAGPAPAPKGNSPLLQAGASRVGHSTEGAAPDVQCKTLAHFIDHTLLKPTATDREIL